MDIPIYLSSLSECVKGGKLVFQFNQDMVGFGFPKTGTTLEERNGIGESKVK